MAAGNTYTPIATTTLGSSTASVTFGTGSPLSGNIPSTYTDLILIINGGITVVNYSIRAQFNGDTTTVYSQTSLAGNGTTVTSDRASGAASISVVGGTNGIPANTLETIGIVNVMNYSNTTTYKTVLTRTASAAKTVEELVGLWRSTAAITQITLFSGSGNLYAGTTLSLYGILAA